MLKTNRALFVASFILLLFATLSRTVPHVANVTPVLASVMVAGFLIGRRSMAAAIGAMLVTMIISDAMVGFHWTAPYVYIGLGFAAVAGRAFANWVAEKKSARSVATLGFGAFAVTGVASTVFFVISNLGVWFVGELYEKTWDGLVQCFVLAIPFFHQALASDLAFGTVMLTAAALLASPAPVAATVSGERTRG